MLYYKNGVVKPPHKIANLIGWKLLEYNIPAYDDKTHIIDKYEFEELDNKVIAHAIIVEQVEENKNKEKEEVE